MKRKLTVKQWRFATYLVGPAHGNQTSAARSAGYKGDSRQLAVQGSVNMKNPQIREKISEMLEAMVEPSLMALADGLNATKRHAFVVKSGEILYTDPEPDHRVRVATAGRVLDSYQRTSNGYAAGSDANVLPADEDSAELRSEMAAAEGGGDHGADGVAQLEPADLVLLQQAAEIDAELADLDGERHDRPGGEGNDH